MASGAINICRVSIIVPTWNGAGKIERCLTALRYQDLAEPIETIVVNDGSTDNTLEILKRFPEVLVITQPNLGPATARNRGAREARGDFIVFTDDDCEPARNWLTELLKPFAASDVIGVKGTYRTRQPQVIARFVQLDYEDRYRLMTRQSAIDFIDTYSAAFRRERFLEIGGFDTSFPVACAEDAELSYRMAKAGWKLAFVPAATVYHRHPWTLGAFLQKKFKFALWRIVALRKNPSKAVRDSHTPQVMKLQMLLAPTLLAAAAYPGVSLLRMPLIVFILSLFIASTIPFSFRTFSKDPLIGCLSPFILALRSFAQFAGVVSGIGRTLIESGGERTIEHYDDSQCKTGSGAISQQTPPEGGPR